MLDAGMIRIMRAIYQSIVKFLTNFRAPRETLSVRELRSTLDNAWVANGFAEFRLAYARGFARQRFNEVVGEYVHGYFERTGVLPVGWHQVGQGSLRKIYFPPPSQCVGLSIASRSSRS